MPRIFLLTFSLIFLGCSSSSSGVFAPAVERVLAQPDEVELLTLNPEPAVLRDPALPAGPEFHGYLILTRAKLTNPDLQRELFDLVAQGVRTSDGTVAACFNPRHGLRVTRGADVVEFVICYECLSLDVHGPAGAREGHTTVSGVQRGVDRIFGQVGLTIQDK